MSRADGSRIAVSDEVLSPAEIWQRLRADWLILQGNGPAGNGPAGNGPAGNSSADEHKRWVEQVGDRACQLKAFLKAFPHSAPLVLLAEPNPQQFLAAFWAALLSNWNIVLANPSWGLQEWQSVSEQVKPAVIWGKAVPQRFLARGCLPGAASAIAPDFRAPQILIPTGGTSGQIKFAHHTWKTLLAAVDGFRQHFAPDKPIDSYCVLPLYHVSGLMQVLRSVVSNGQVAIAPFKALETIDPSEALPFLAGPFLAGEQSDDCTGPITDQSLRVVSLVPTQLHRLLQSDKSQWLRQFHAVLLGGAPPWPDLLDAAQQQQIPLSLSYGMTETAAMVTALKPEAFLSGDRSSGAPLPHATLQLLRNRVLIHAPSVSLNASPNQTLLTDDLGYFDANGHLHLTGRASQTIISGGENISPTEVEVAIRNTGQVKDICVFALPDAQWGEAVTAAYVPESEAVTVCTLQHALNAASASHATPLLSRYKHPKHWIAMKSLPRNAQGKLNRKALMAQAQTQIQTQTQIQSQQELQSN